MANRKALEGGQTDDADPPRRQEQWRRQLQQLLLEATRIWKGVNRAEERADALVQDLQELLSASGKADSIGRNKPRRSTREKIRGLESLALQGVSELTIKNRVDGRISVQVDRGPEFELPPTLAALLSALAMENHRGPERLVGWKSKVEIAELLEKTLERSFDGHAITQLISRLRTELFKRGGVNPYLLQTSPRHGARFALRRKDGA